MNEITTSTQTAPDQRKPRERTEVADAIPLLDSGRFEHMQRVATVMARSTLMPETLYMTGDKNNKVELPYEQILSNCFLVVNQAVRWGLDPFAVAQCVSVVHGKLCYEGKLVSAVLQAKMGISLTHHITGTGEDMRVYLSDKPFTSNVVELLTPGYRRSDMRIFDGSVAEWKTTGNGTPWTPKNFPRMLIYRGTRDWCRIYEPALMLGVYTPDEMVDMEDRSRFRAAKNVTPAFDPLSDEPIAMQKLAASGKPDQEQADDAADEREQLSKADDQPETKTLSGEAETADPETGEITDNTDGEATDSSSVPDASSDAPTSSQAGASTAGGDSSSSQSSPAPILVRYARDVLNRAAHNDTDAAVLKKTEGVWATELSKLPDADKEKAQAIAKSMRAVFSDPGRLDGVIEHYAEVLGVDKSELSPE